MRRIIVLLITTTIAAISGVSLRAECLVVSTRNSSLVMTVNEGKAPIFQYFGSRLANAEDVFLSGMTLSDPLYPQYGINCSREYAIQATHNDGNMSLDLVFTDYEKSKTDGGELTAVRMKDKFYPFYVTVYYQTYADSDVIETWTEISHSEKKPVTLYRFASAALPVRRDGNFVTHLHGSWGDEGRVFENELDGGTFVIENKDGVRNSHTDNPSFMLSLGGKATENTGDVIGGTLAWGGNYRFLFAMDNSTRITRVIAGINEEQSHYILEPEEIFSTPVFAFTYSDEGKGGVSRNFHRWARNHRLNHGNELRDVLLNSWEGVSFNIKQETMEQMMKDCADMGLELFVMDDGWFGDKYARNNGTSGLGDWMINREKLPEGIEGLIASAKSCGIKFGIWIEPEMLNTNSELYEKHPDWVIQQPHREHTPGRGGTQLVLDLSNPEVQDFVFAVVDDLMTAHPEIAYIKWDDNMTMTNVGSTYLPKDRQSHTVIEYHRGMDKVLKRIQEKYPDLVMQSCASGGGRVNYGILPYYDEFWTSDNTDALQRIYMQWGISHFFPSVAMASHVSATKNHQTGRITPLKFRFDVAMSGRLGMELQPKNMSEEEKDFARRAIASYKSVRPVVQQGELYRLISPYDRTGFASLMYVSEDKERAVFYAYKMEHFVHMQIPPFKMAGLDPNASYEISELNMGEKPVRQHGRTFTGAFLMKTGIELPMNKEYDSYVLELRKVK